MSLGRRSLKRDAITNALSCIKPGWPSSLGSGLRARKFER